MTIITLPQWLTLTSLPSLGIVAATLLIGYVIFEVGFFFHYECQLVPRANQIPFLPPAPYRDYANVKDRGKLLSRILDRLSERISAKGDNAAASDVYYNFIESWFQKKSEDEHYEKFSEQFDMATLDGGLCPPPPAMIRMAWPSLGGLTSADDESNGSSSDSLSVIDAESSRRDSINIMQKKECIGNNNNDQNDRIKKGNMDEFLSWAFFGVPFSTVQSTPSMQEALDDLYIVMQIRTGISFEPGMNPNYKPRSFTFEEVKSLYRPFLVYASVALMRMIANCILYVMGFRQHSCKRGLRYWHRPAKQQRGCPLGPPFLFFHGIAPGGHAPYLPMILSGILRGQLSYQFREIFLFENKPVSYALCFEALSEEDTIQGVLEAIQTHLDSSAANNLTLCGHSLGSCQLTWMTKAPEIKNRIRSLILIDPVTILLSEPDVVVNFLYTRQEIEDSYDGNSFSWAGSLIRFFNETKIHLVASSEMFIEYYLRRNFAWYNSELWLEDIPDDVDVVVCLSERDEIANTPKVVSHIALHNSKLSRRVCHSPSIKTIIWRDVGHAHCVGNPEKWSEIHHAMSEIKC